MKIIHVLLAILIFAVNALQAQLVADGATNTLSNVTNTFTGNVIVGTNGSFTLLTLSNNALLTNSTHGVIGLNATAKSNAVQLISASARWRMGNNLFVGSNGAASRLVVSNGALVENFDGVLANTAASSNNIALVTGGGSVWSNRGDLTVGFSGRENQLIVSNGGRVGNRFGYLGRQPGSSNNLARVTGSGSVWTNQFDLAIGFNDRSNRLIIEAGGVVSCANGVVSSSSSSGNNEVLVTGAGSLWSNRFFLFMGDVAGRNRLVVSNGATVWSGGGILGTLSPAISNQVIVTGSGSMWTNESSLSLGESSPGNRVDVSDGGQLACADGFVGLAAGANNNTVLLTGAGSTWNNLANLVVGNSGSGNALIASNGAAVLADDLSVGHNSSAVSNSVTATDPGTRWQIANHLYVGSNGPFNRMVISNGATVFNAHLAYIGVNSGANSNTVIVTGPGSAWTNSDYFFIGQSSAGNQLIVSNGAKVRAGNGFAGIGVTSSAASNNAALVTGSNSFWGINGRLDVGRFGRNNQITVTDGGAVSNSSFTLIGFDSPGNQVLVTGTNSTWINNDSLTVGYAGVGNRLVVSNGAVALVSTNVIVGEHAVGTNNRVVVDNGTLRVANTGGTGVMEVRRGTNQFNAGLMDVDHLLLTNTLSKFEFNGGTLITRGAFIRNSQNFVVGAVGTNRAIWDVRAGVSNTFLDETIVVGGSASFNQLILTNGNLLTNSGFADLGQNFGANSNSAVVAGIGSRWLLGDGIVVGRSGSGNRLVASNGAAVVTASISYFGFDPGSSNNEAVVTGPGTIWTNGLDYGVRVGYNGSNNRLLVSDGALLAGYDDIIGESPSSSNNLALVTGVGSMWRNRRELYVGSAGDGNQLVISNGGTVFGTANRYIGHDVGAAGNIAIVTDPGSRWLGDDSLYVGSDGVLNRLLVRNGGQMTSGLVTIGGTSIGNNNQAMVTDAGSSWTNGFDMTVGDSGSANTLVVSNGATLVGTGHGFIGRSTGASSNAAVLTDLGTRWLLSSNLYVGSNGAFSRLVISNGARVANAVGNIGFNGSSLSNLAVVTGPGSVWSNAFELHVGNSGRSNQLVVSNGGTVFAVGGSSIGFQNNANGNSATVTDAGTSYRFSGNFAVGDSGAFNRLIITNGGQVLSTGNGIIGFNSGGRSNLTIVTGSGSLWSNAASVFAGYSGAGNRLVVSNGAVVNNGSGFIGLASSSNVVVVTGSGSLWHNRSAISVGHFNGDNQLMVSDGGAVFSGNGVIVGVETNSPRNRVVVDGGFLRATNAFGNSYLDVRQGTNVLNSGLIEVNRLYLTNVPGYFEFNGGTLVSSGTAINNGRVFTVGNGASPATFTLRSGTHSFANNLIVASNASLIGNGTITGILTVQPGGKISPGTSVGKIILSNSPVLQGATIMEINRNGTTLTNDEVQVGASLGYGGALTVTNIGPTPLAAGDRFQLFSAPTYAGSFETITLPPLGSSLSWTNKLLVDGSLEVIGPSLPKFTGITVSGPNVVLSGTNGTAGANYAVLTATNVTLPSSNWVSLITNQFGAGGAFSFTNPITLGEPKRFFRLRTP